jgi:hypothetical protein
MVTPVSAPADIPATVAEIDLRSGYDELASCEAFDELQRDLARRVGAREGDLGRVLLIDSTHTLHDHVEGLEKVLLSRSTRSVLCLLIGPPNGRPTAPAGTGGGDTPGREPAKAGPAQREEWTEHPEATDPGTGGLRPGRDTAGGHRRRADDPGSPSRPVGAYRPGRATTARAGPREAADGAGPSRALFAGDRDGPDPGVAGRRPGRGGPVRGGWGRPEPPHPRPAPATGSDAAAILRPRVLSPPAVATLWVSDSRGVGWVMGGTRPDSLTVEGSPYRESPLLVALLDALRQPAVFDRVVELVTAMPEATAAPGLHAVVGRVDDAVLDEAERQAIASLAPADDGAATPTEPPIDLLTEPLSLLIPDLPDRRGGAGRGTPPVVLPDGLVGSAVRRCRDRIADADSAAKGMRSLRVLRSGRQPGMAVAADMADAAAELAELRYNLAQEFVDIDTRRGLDQANRTRLDTLGVATEPPFGVDHRGVVGSLRTFVHGTLDRGRPLDEVTQWLTTIARRLFPSGSAGFADDLGEVCPDGLLAGLENPGPIRLPLSTARVLIPIFVCCALAGFVSSFGPGAMGTLVALLLGVVAAGMACTGARLLATARRVTVDDDSVVDLIAVGVVALLGAGTGWLLMLRLEGRLPLPARVALLAGALLGLCLWPVVAWRSAVERWRPQLDDAQRAVEALARLTERVARYEWVLADARRAANSITNAVCGALLDVHEVLAAHPEGSGEHPELPTPEAVPGLDVEVAVLLQQRLSEVAKVVREDLIDLVRAVFTRVWTDLGRDALEAPGSWVRQETSRLLDVYGAHLALRGVHETPPFGRASARRESLVDAVWKESSRVAGVLAAGVTGAGILQLNAVRDLRFLDVSPASATLARFAPRAARGALAHVERADDAGATIDSGDAGDAGGAGFPAAAASPAAGDLVWTDGGQVAGLLRLTGLRAGAVATLQEDRR